MMNRRTFLYALMLGTLSAPLAGKAEQAGKVSRIGILQAGSLAAHEHHQVIE